MMTHFAFPYHAQNRVHRHNAVTDSGITLHTATLLIILGKGIWSGIDATKRGKDAISIPEQKADRRSSAKNVHLI
jgi:hypothetical protein